MTPGETLTRRLESDVGFHRVAVRGAGDGPTALEVVSVATFAGLSPGDTEGVEALKWVGELTSDCLVVMGSCGFSGGPL